jgi:hypothetical protein
MKMNEIKYLPFFNYGYDDIQSDSIVLKLPPYEIETLSALLKSLS